MNYVSYFKRKYRLDEEDVEIMVGCAKEILLHLLFKADKYIYNENKEWAYEEYRYWIFRCVQEQIEKKGLTSARAYSENGISITFGEAQISSSLRNEIVPFVGFK